MAIGTLVKLDKSSWSTMHPLSSMTSLPVSSNVVMDDMSTNSVADAVDSMDESSSFKELNAWVVVDVLTVMAASVDAVPYTVEAASDAAAVATGTVLVAWTSSRINSSQLASSMRLGPVSVI